VRPHVGDPRACSAIEVTGANGSGKSTLIRQIALLAVMAQVRCMTNRCVTATKAGRSGALYLRVRRVPIVVQHIRRNGHADYASFAVYDALFSRLSNDDSIEANLSTFGKEMSTMGAVLASISSFPKVLVIVDELGRGTSPDEGVGIAHAIAEELIRAKVRCAY
jgi:DNA mismatch repair protein MSH4